MKSRIFFVTVLIFLTLILILITIPLAFCFNRTAPQTFLLNRDYSNLTKSEIRTRLNTDFPLPPCITLAYQNQVFNVSTASISAKLNYDKIMSNLLFDFISHGPLYYLLYPYASHSFPLDFTYDSLALDTLVADISPQISKPFIPSRFELTEVNNAKSVQVKTGELGYTINKVALKNEINTAFTNWQLTLPIGIPVMTTGFVPTIDQVQKSQLQAQKIVGKTINLTGGAAPFALDDKTLLTWMNLDSSYNYDQVLQSVKSISTSLNIDSQDAVFKFENGQVLEFQPSISGKIVLEDQLAQSIIKSIDQLLTLPDTSLDLPIPFTDIAPKITTESANDLGIKDLLGRGTSTFKHSTAIRNHNIQKGSSVVNRLLVAPGDTFSFIQALGDVSEASGYKKAYIIRQGKTELDVGGGICQISTTFFRAMLNSGVDIIERQNHAYRVSYYEEDMPPGYDATVFIPHPDLRFVNDTGHHLLIQNTYNAQNKSLTYEIYGTSDGRTIEITNYRKWGASPPPPTRYIDDPTLPPGKLIKEETAIPGLKTAFDWKVTRNGEVLHQKTFTSNYTPWAAVYRRGPTL